MQRERFDRPLDLRRLEDSLVMTSAASSARFVGAAACESSAGPAANELTRFFARAAGHDLPSMQQPSERAAPQLRPQKVLRERRQLQHRVRPGALADRLAR